MSQIVRLIKLLGNALIKYKFTIICLIYLCVVSVLATSNTLEQGVSKPSIINALSFVLVINLLAKIKNSTLSTIFTAILSVLISFDAYFAFVYKSIIGMGIMASIFETNTTEAKEALGTAAPMALLVLVATTALLFLSKRELKELNFSTKKTAVILLAYLILFIPGMLYRKLSVNEVWMGSFKSHPLTTAQNIISAHFPIIYGDILTLTAYQNEMYQLRKYRTTERILPDGITLSGTDSIPDKIFIILGESSYRQHYSLYGYEVKTTPFLDSLANEPSADMKYYNGLAPATFTRDALRIILTFSNPSDKQPFFTNKNILDLAHKAGYETIWASNQSRVELDGSYIGLISSEATHAYFPDEPYDDLNLVSYIERIYSKDKKQLFILHLVGSHLTYSTRYDDIDRKAITGDDKNHTVQYDRTIHHTDRVLRNAYHILQKDSSSVLYYFPDHGEIIGVGHGFMYPGLEQFDIPLITINNSYKNIDNIVSKYINKDCGLINTTCAIYFLSETMGYTVSQENIEKTLSDGKQILHADGNIYRYEDIPR